MNELIAQEASYHSTMLEIAELLRVTHSFTSVLEAMFMPFKFNTPVKKLYSMICRGVPMLSLYVCINMRYAYHAYIERHTELHISMYGSKDNPMFSFAVNVCLF